MAAALVPFRPPAPAQSAPRLIRLDDVELAFPATQKVGTRLILTQSTYSLQKWLDALGNQDRMLLTADRLSLSVVAREALDHRGPWRHFQTIDLDAGEAWSGEGGSGPDARDPTDEEQLLISAYGSASAEERLALCRQAAELRPESAVAALALASACREGQDTAAARRELDRALALAPGWEAAHYEDGKFWLACEDMERARAAFERACRAMPTFAAAWSNLGATLGELDRPEEALEAFQQALITDPHSFLVLNNIGVVARELGRLDESEAALMRVNHIAPDFVFGHYNLGHTRLLAGRVQESLAAYEEGWRRDTQKNRRQGCRLAVVHLLCGNAEIASMLFWESANHAPSEEREDLLLEAFEIVRTFAPDGKASPAQVAFLDGIARELRSS
jgi:tetratricopeptide (TPR) repeat protein